MQWALFLYSIGYNDLVVIFSFPYRDEPHHGIIFPSLHSMELKSP